MVLSTHNGATYQVKDFTPSMRVSTVSRAVVQADLTFHPDGGRFFADGILHLPAPRGILTGRPVQGGVSRGGRVAAIQHMPPVRCGDLRERLPLASARMCG
jgi:hypothetical protein